MNQFAIYLGADGGFNGRVVNTAENLRFWAEFDAVACLDIALHDAVQDHVGDDHGAPDTALVAHQQGGPAAQFAGDVAVDIPVEMKPADEFDIAVDAGLGADQGIDFCFFTRFRFEHLLHLCPEYRRSPRFPPTYPAPSTRRPAGNYDWRLGRCQFL